MIPMGTESSRRSTLKPASAPGTAGPTRSPADPRDEEILRAAFAVFTEKGFHGATMLDVAGRARASKTTLYARFESKEVLFQALVGWGTRQGTGALDAIIQDQTLDPLTALHLFATRVLSLMMQPEKLALFRIAVAEGGRLPQLGKIYSSFTRDHGTRLGHLLAKRLVEAGLIEIGDPEEYGHSFIGLLQGELFMRALLGATPPPSAREIERHARRAMTRLVHAFAPSRNRKNSGKHQRAKQPKSP
jgi:TetR/AcrR family transcriptional regulator, mexJK operon transcriptional repressor